MKRLFLILILTLSFQSLIRADDISDFELEGMSIGDSLLDYFSKDEIEDYLMLDYYTNLPKNYREIYGIVEFKRLPRFKTYTNVTMDFFKKDNEFIIRTISGVIFVNNAEECHDKQNQIDDELSKVFKNTSRETNQNNHSFDKTGNSKTKAINYWFDNDDLVTLICTDWSNEITSGYKWDDNLALEIKSKEFNNFLIEAYK
tara:strand:+ start:34 stop:636 length:603 start_codon:yes stop_codon:yes gene_type:complete